MRPSTTDAPTWSPSSVMAAPCHLLPCGAKARPVLTGMLGYRNPSPHPSRLRRATFPQGKAKKAPPRPAELFPVCYSCPWYRLAAAMKSRNRGWALLGRLFSSGWNWTPTNQGWSGSSTISTSRPSGERPASFRPGLGQLLPVVVVELIAVAVALGDLVCAIGPPG